MTNDDFMHMLNNFMQVATDWNKDSFGNIFGRKKSCLVRLKGIQKESERGLSAFLTNMGKSLLVDYEKILKQEDQFWFKNPRSKWFVKRERNTRFFHISTLLKKKKQNISMLKDSNDTWIQDQEVMQQLVRDFFLKLYTLELHAMCYISAWNFQLLSHSDKQWLNHEVSEGEIKAEVF